MSAVQVIVAERAGFCSGVKNAVSSLVERAEQQGGGSTLGPLVHNEQVVDHLKKKSIQAINDPGEATGSFLAVRTHGVSPEVMESLKALESLEIIDLTCPRVRKVQEIAAGLNEKGIHTIIFGNSRHPEVEGLLGWAGEKAAAVSSPEEMKKLELSKPSALISQTTANPGLFEKVKEIYREKDPQGKIFDTLCPETRLREQEAVKLAQRVEALVVVGSASSANTTALFNCCRQLKPSCRISNAKELDPAFIKQYRVIGVTAGASTPPWTIKEVVERMENENLDARKEEQFDFDGEVKVAQVGEQITGKVARVTDEEVYVDIGAKSEAVLPAEEVHLDEDKTLADVFAPENDIEVTVLDIDEQEGKVVVSHKRLAREKRLQELEQALADNIVLEGRVKQVVPAGVVVDLGAGVEGFMPGSLVDIKFIPDFKEFQDQQVQFKVQEFDREKGKLILNRKKLQEEEEAKKKEETLNSLEEGSTITGTVKRLTNFGAFVDIGGIDGLVHISELAWERVGHPGDVLKTGQEVEVRVLEVIPEQERISLSIRKTQPDPWTRAVEELESDQLVTGKVTRLVNFGAFIELKPGVEGLAHISQLADYHVKHPSEVLNEGEEVEVKILDVKPKAKRISLSLKEARGALHGEESAEGEEAEDGGVTLGDVFGNLFDKEGLTVSEEKVSADEETVDEEVEGEAEAETETAKDEPAAEEESPEEAPAAEAEEEQEAKTEKAEEVKAAGEETAGEAEEAEATEEAEETGAEAAETGDAEEEEEKEAEQEDEPEQEGEKD